MAKLQGQQALDFLMANPSSQYTVTSGNVPPALAEALSQVQAEQEQANQPGFLKSLATGITKPFRGLLGEAETLGRFLVDPSQQVEKQAEKSVFMTDEESQALADNPLLFGLQTGAGIGAWAVPGNLGGGLAGAGKSGLLSGGLTGFSQGEEGNLLKSTLVGSGTGAGTSMALYKLLGALSKGKGKPTMTEHKKGTLQDMIQKNQDSKGLVPSEFNAKMNNITRMTDKQQAANMLDDLKSSIPIDDDLAMALNNQIDDLAKTLPKPIAKLGAGDKLSKYADKQELGQLSRNLGGKPTKGQGGVRLLKDMKKQGILEIGDSADDALIKTQQLLDDKGSIVAEQIDDMAKQGVTGDVKSLRSFLKEQIDGEFVPEMKRPYIKALDSLDESTKGMGASGQVQLLDDIPIDDYYKIKQSMGKLGYSNKFTPPKDQQIASAYRALYKKMNSQLDDTLKVGGFTEFRTLNKQVSTASDASRYLKGKMDSSLAKKPWGFGDVMTGGLGMVAAGGNPAGAVAGLGIKRAAQSPKADAAFLAMLRKFAELLKKSPKYSASLPALSPGLQSGLQKSGPIFTSNLTSNLLTE